MKNKNLPFLIFWFLVCVGVVWFYTRHAFLRPTDDPKEAILYSSLFLFNLFLMPKWFYARKVMGSLPFFLVFVYLGYGFLNVLFVATAHFEGMALWGKEALLILAFCFLPQKKHILLWLSMAVVSLLFVNNGLHYSFRNVSIAQRFEKIIPEVEKHFSTNVVSNSVSNSLEPSLQIQQAQKNSRLCMYQNTWEGFLAKPLLGWGVGSFRYNYLRFIKPTDPEQSLLMKGHKVWVMYPHNESLKQLFESGFVGTLLFYMVYLLPCFAAFSLFLPSYIRLCIFELLSCPWK